MVKVYDCFLFNNELNMLNLRLHELDNVVDFFVLVEATTVVFGVEEKTRVHFRWMKN